MDGTKVSFAIPEYRAERIAVLLEVAQIGAHGLCLDFCRQPPIARYHPQILDPWLKAGRDDPRKMAVGSPEFLAWAKHRADFVNLFMRDLRAQLRELEQNEAQGARAGPHPRGHAEPELDGRPRSPHLAKRVGWMKSPSIRCGSGTSIIPTLPGPTSSWPVPTVPKSIAEPTPSPAKASPRTHVAFSKGSPETTTEGVDGIALFQTDSAFLDPALKALLGPLFSHLADATAVSEKLAAARIKQPQMSEGERHFGLDNHSLLPQLGRAARLSLDTI